MVEILSQFIWVSSHCNHNVHHKYFIILFVNFTAIKMKKKSGLFHLKDYSGYEDQIVFKICHCNRNETCSHFLKWSIPSLPLTVVVIVTLSGAEIIKEIQSPFCINRSFHQYFINVNNTARVYLIITYILEVLFILTNYQLLQLFFVLMIASSKSKSHLPNYPVS